MVDLAEDIAERQEDGRVHGMVDLDFITEGNTAHLTFPSRRLTLNALVVDGMRDLEDMGDIVFGKPAILEWGLFQRGRAFGFGGKEIKYGPSQPQPSNGMISS